MKTFEFDMLFSLYDLKEKDPIHNRKTAVICALELLATGYHLENLTDNPVTKLADQIEEALKTDEKPEN